MKILKLWTIILTLFICFFNSLMFVSCSNDNEPIVKNNDAENQSLLQRKTGLYPENTANDYDYTGELYYDISESYLTKGLISTSTQNTILQIEQIANLNSEFQSIAASGYVIPSAARLDYIMNNQIGCMTDIIATSVTSLNARLSLTAFLNTVMANKALGKDIDDMYSFIIDYETTTIADTALTAADRKVILITTSIVRYELYFAKKHRRKPRDRDWDISWGNFLIAVEESNQSPAKAIVAASVAGIIYNK